ncbi:MAG: UbiA family prenyltransferase [Anaerolineaceae bacterium]|nr:UbiA family prenyltransferase [Anaerolineaceae bacterium]
MKNTIKGLLRLTHFNEYAWFVVITTILGITSAKGQLTWQFAAVLAANLLAVGFAFMVNDIENAPDEALSPAAGSQNPIASGLLTPKAARLGAFLAALIAGLLFALLGWIPLLVGLLSLILGYFYSAKAIQLKSITFVNLIAQCLMLAGLQFLSGYFSFQTLLTRQWYWPFIFVLTISIYAELRYGTFKIKTNSDRSAYSPESRTSHTLILVVLLIGLFSAFVSFVTLNLIPLWVIVNLLVLTALFLIPLIIRARNRENRSTIQNSLLRPVERAAAIGLLLQYILPWLNQFIDLGIFN